MYQVLLCLLLLAASAPLGLARPGHPPSVLAVDPPPGVIDALTNLTVTFTEPVTNLAPSDLLLNGHPAAMVVGSGDVYTFILETQPGYGPIQISWDAGHAITGLDDAPPLRFDETAPDNVWAYELVDLAAPWVARLTPSSGATVRQLAQIEVLFSEPVSGVDAADLFINEQAASSVTVLGVGRYLFQFPPPSNGLVQVRWADDAGIRDFAALPNAFDGGAWSYQLDPGAGLPTLRINEFLASNVGGLRDEQGEEEDWIEILNTGANPVNLGGLSLTDDADDPGKWTFPATNLGPGQFLVVFASMKDRRVPGARLHTNFKLNPAGDYLALFNNESPRVAISEFAPEYPGQRNNYSYGYDLFGAFRHFSIPTPGLANGVSSIDGAVPPVHFNVERGFFEVPFPLILSSALSGATIRYTTDGSEPLLTNGFTYAAPLLITNTTVLRAAAFRTGKLPSISQAQTYLFLDQVLRQPNNPKGFPIGPTVMAGYPSDYEMDPEIVTNALYKDLIKDALKALPVISLVCSSNDMFGLASSGPGAGIYTHPTSRGPAWERPCSVEMFFPDGRTGFQINAGMQIQGNAARDPQKQPKHPIRLLFKGDYGPQRLEYQMFPDSPVTSFDTLNMRADFNFSWLHWNPAQRPRGQRTRDAWTKDTMRDMGNLATHNRYFHLYINGLYWGIYDPSERPDGSFAASYLGGEREDYDVVNEPIQNGNTAVDGDLVAYNQMLALSNLGNIAQYDRMKFYLDLPQFIDYMLLHFYVGHEDWGNDKNFYCLRKRDGSMGFKYLPWDGENLLGLETNYNRVSNTDVPSGLHTKLLVSAQYRMDYADRVHKHLFNGGALTPEAVTQRWMNRARQVELAIVAESARWGDYRRDVHQYQTGPYELYTRDNHWRAEQSRLVNQYFPVRTGILLSQLRAAGLYPNVSAPRFNQHGGPVSRGFQLSMTATNPIYFTTDGSDPRAYGTAQLAPTAIRYQGALGLTNSVIVKARALFGTNWSALNEATFTVDALAAPLRITEIMYNPPGGDAYEFLELHNVSGLTLNVGYWSIDGAGFVFAPNTFLAPGKVIVLGSSTAPGNWTNRYPGVVPFGLFTGKLDNGGERLAILNVAGNTLWSVTYDDQDGWPLEPDGRGASLEILDVFGNPNDPSNWRASLTNNGTPGQLTPPPEPGAVVLNEILAHNLTAVPHAGGFPDWIELHNGSTQTVDLAGWGLTDDGHPRKFVFPANTRLDPGRSLVVWCDTNAAAPGLHTGFALSREGETLFLHDALGARRDAVSFGPQAADFSVARFGDTWSLAVPTPGAANQAAATASSTNLVINEWLANAAPGGSDWIELYNRDPNAPVSLRGVYLGTSNATFQITSLAFVPAGGFVQFFADERAGANHLDFKLAQEGGSIVLYDESSVERNRVAYGAQSQSVSQGRLPDGHTNVVGFPGSASPAASNYQLSYNGPIFNELLAVNRAGVTNALGRTADFVEFHNPAATEFDMSGLRFLSGDTEGPPVWTFPSGTRLAAGGYLVVWCDDEQPPSTVFEPVLNAGFALRGEGGTIRLAASNGQELQALAYGLQTADLPIGRNGTEWTLLSAPTPGAVNASPAPLAAARLLRLNEWMADPASGDDWFEICSLADQPVLLSGLFLVDSPAAPDLSHFQIAPLSYIGARGYAKFVADSDPRQGPDHVNFVLDAQGEALRLYSTNLGIIDTVSFGAQTTGMSQGRLPDGATNLVSFPATPTPAESNYLPLPNAVVNEVLTRGQTPAQQFIELHNPSGQAVNVGGWFLSDSAANLKKFRIADDTMLPASGFLVFAETQFDGGPGSLAPFRLDGAIGGRVFLSAADAAGNLTGMRAQVEFGPAELGVSFGRYLTTLGADFPAQESPSAETANGAPNVGPLVINELMYHPPDLGGTNDNTADEYLELHNLTTNTVRCYDALRPSHTWRLRGGVDFDFPPDIALPPRGFLLLVGFDPDNASALAAFRAQYGLPASVTLLGPYQGKLANSGERLELLKPDAPLSLPTGGTRVPYVLVERVDYADAPPWPLEADGAGASLQRARPREYGHEPANWRADAPTPGRANAPGGGFTDTDQDGLSDTWETANGLDPMNPADAALDRDGDGVSNADEFLHGTDPRNPASAARGPVIVAQPQNQSGVVGSNVVFTVSAQGAAPLAYQWRFNGVSLPSALAASLAVTNLDLDDAGAYSVVVRNSAGFIVSQDATLSVNLPPTITLDPISRTVTNGGSATFTVAATGRGTLRYQWQMNGQDISAATNATFTLNNVQASHAGAYAAIVRDDIGAASSALALLTVLVRPEITRPLGSFVVATGSEVTLDLGVTGSRPMGFRWRRNGAFAYHAIDNSIYVLTNVQAAHAGMYTVVVTNAANPNPGLLSPVGHVTVVARPTNQVTEAGATVTFSATVSGQPTNRLQWFFRGAALPNETNQLLALSNVQLAQEGAYTLWVTNQGGATGSFSAELVIDSDRDGLPDAWELARGFLPNDPGDGRADADGDGLSNADEYSAGTDYLDPQSHLRVGLRWHSGPVLEFLAVSNRSYSVQFKESIDRGVWRKLADAEASPTNRLELIPDAYAMTRGRLYRLLTPKSAETNLGPLILESPRPVAVRVGGSAQFNVVAAGVGPLSYQWRLNQTNLAAATQPTLTLTNVQPPQAGDYSVRVTDPRGNSVSEPGRLTVRP